MGKMRGLICTAACIALFGGNAFCESVPTDFVKVKGATINGKVNGSNVFMEDWSKVIIDNLYVCDHEVTQKEYETYCNYGGKETPTENYGKGDNVPVYYVSWYDAIVYCNLRSMNEGLTPAYSIKGETDPKKWKGIVSADGKYCGPSIINLTWNTMKYDGGADGYRLLTEEEWEYIARDSSNNLRYDTYSGSNIIEEVAWYSGNSWITEHKGNSSIRHARVYPIKGKKPNSRSIYDMSGNVAEWCWNWHGQELKIKNEPAVRGGSVFSDENNCASVARSSLSAFMRDKGVGFRIARLCIE